MTCPKCNTEGCLTDIDKDITAYFCETCGYRSRSDWTAKRLEFQPTIVNMDMKTKDMVWKDCSTGLYWFPIAFDIPNVGVLYPQGTVNNVEWVYMPYIDLTDDEKRKNPGKKERPDDYRRKTFKQLELKEAFKLLKVGGYND